jgi:hypothetical protein
MEQVSSEEISVRELFEYMRKLAGSQDLVEGHERPSCECGCAEAELSKRTLDSTVAVTWLVAGRLA